MCFTAVFQVEDKAYPITVDAIKTVFSSYGWVQKLSIFEKNSLPQVLVQYPDEQSAANAKAALEGHAIYDGGYNRVRARLASGKAAQDGLHQQEAFAAVFWRVLITHGWMALALMHANQHHAQHMNSACYADLDAGHGAVMPFKNVVRNVTCVHVRFIWLQELCLLCPAAAPVLLTTQGSQRAPQQ